MRKTVLAEEEYYHVYNRGVEQRDIFLEPRGYERFIFYLFACNDLRPLLNSKFHYRGLASLRHWKPRNTLVDLLCFCLMPNHFHLLIRQIRSHGIALFLQKLGTAYAMYFNVKHRHSGSLFQGPYQSIHVARDEYLFPLTRYIHLNPLDLLQPQWKERGLRDPRRAHGFLSTYQWSSYPDYLQSERLPGLLDTALIRKCFRGPADYAAYVERWTARTLHPIRSLTIEKEPLQ